MGWGNPEIESLKRTIERGRRLDDWRIWQLSRGLLRLRAKVACACMGYPARSLKIIGVTGTHGKTTTTELMASLFRAAGYRVSWVNSLGASIGGRCLNSTWRLTTPGPFIAQGLLRQMKQCRSDWVILEATSHGLAQCRLGGIAFRGSVVTNLTAAHLDYHGNLEHYLAAKALLIRNTVGLEDKGAIVVLNRDDPYYDRFAALSGSPPLSYGLSSEAAVRATGIDMGDEGSSFVVSTPAGRFSVILSLPGLFNIYNALAALSVGYSQGIDPSAMIAGLRMVTEINGRMSRITEGQPYTVVIDFAHTPHALEQVLRFFRSRIKGRIILVFGCPGIWDPDTHPAMGEQAGRLADYVIVTRDDNDVVPVDVINQAIVEGLRRVGRRASVDYVVLPDRQEAIQKACERAEAGDLVLITGKGHESFLNIDGKEMPWNDYEVARMAITKTLGHSS